MKDSSRKLRNGFTTGTCAAAAAEAAAYRLLTGTGMTEVPIETPDGTHLKLGTEDLWCHDGRAGCGVRKDAGDDIDATDGLLICAEVERSSRPGIHIDGGSGVGRVTKKGLDQPVGNAAINSVPRRMITEAVRHAAEDAGFDGGLNVLITVPGGEEVALKTFNGRLGIEGGISILGTSGIVHPMSRRALLESMYAEMRMHRASSGPWLCLSPGNYGERFAFDELGVDPEKEMLCSNFIGETVDKAVDLGFCGILFSAHIGKFIKVSGGIMNTHSKEADCRMELMAAAALKAGCDADTARKILSCNTTDDAIDLLRSGPAPEGLFQKTMDAVISGIAHYLALRCGGKLETGAVIFSDRYGKLAETDNAGALLAHLRRSR